MTPEPEPPSPLSCSPCGPVTRRKLHEEPSYHRVQTVKSRILEGDREEERVNPGQASGTQPCTTHNAFALALLSQKIYH